MQQALEVVMGLVQAIRDDGDGVGAGGLGGAPDGWWWWIRIRSCSWGLFSHGGIFQRGQIEPPLFLNIQLILKIIMFVIIKKLVLIIAVFYSN